MAERQACRDSPHHAFDLAQLHVKTPDHVGGVDDSAHIRGKAKNGMMCSRARCQDCTIRNFREFPDTQQLNTLWVSSKLVEIASDEFWRGVASGYFGVFIGLFAVWAKYAAIASMS